MCRMVLAGFIYITLVATPIISYGLQVELPTASHQDPQGSDDKPPAPVTQPSTAKAEPMDAIQGAALDTSKQIAESKPVFNPDQSSLPTLAPKNATVLLDAQTNLFLSRDGGPVDWPVANGIATSKQGGNNINHIVSQVHFRDADIHVEFMLPAEGKGNSGVYIHGNYECQIFNSLGKTNPDMKDMGSVYGFQKPLLNATREPGQWQVYDIRFRAPQRDESGKITKPGSITSFLNGQKVQDGTEIGEVRSKYHPFRHGTTDYLKKIGQTKNKTMTGPLFLQDHNSPVQFRNVWIVPLDDQAFEYKPK